MLIADRQLAALVWYATAIGVRYERCRNMKECVEGRSLEGCWFCGERSEAMHVPASCHGVWCMDHCPVCSGVAHLIPRYGKMRSGLLSLGRRGPGRLLVLSSTALAACWFCSKGAELARRELEFGE